MKSWDSEWENIHKNEEMGKYPNEHTIRFIAKNFYKYNNRNEIKILEIGCGKGPQIWYLAREGFLSFGIDGSITAIKSAYNKLKKENLKSYLKVGDVILLPYKSNIFDAVLDIECLICNTYENSKKIISEVRRVLKEGGLFFSQTFTDKTYLGKYYNKIDDYTFNNVVDGPLGRKRLIRLLPEFLIMDLYSGFKYIEYEKTFTTSNNRKFISEEWLITAIK